MDQRPRIRTRHPGISYRVKANGSRQYAYWFKGSDGKGHWKTIPGGEKDAVKARAKVIDRIAHGQKVAPSRVLFADFADEWLEEQVALAPKSIESYRTQINMHLIPRLGPRTKLEDVDTNKVAALIASMKKEGYKAWTIRATLTPLSGIMRTAVRRGMVASNPVTQLERSERPKGDATKINILDSDEIRLMLDNCPHPVYKVLLATAVFTGLRISELMSLRWDDVDWEQGILNVRGTKTRAAKREVVIMPALQQMLATFSLEWPGDPVFHNGQGKALSQSSVRRLGLVKSLKRAGITKRIRLHDLRHTYASILLSQGHDFAFVKEQMGHSNIGTTLNLYGHLIDRDKRRSEARKRMEAQFGEVLT